MNIEEEGKINTISKCASIARSAYKNTLHSKLFSQSFTQLNIKLKSIIKSHKREPYSIMPNESMLCIIKQSERKEIKQSNYSSFKVKKSINKLETIRKAIVKNKLGKLSISCKYENASSSRNR